MSDTNAGDRAVFFLLGAAIGAVAALLLAPESGARTRRRLASKGEDVADDLIDAGKELVEKCEDLYERSGKLGGMRRASCPRNIARCVSTASNCWTTPKRLSSVQKAPPRAGSRAGALAPTAISGHASWRALRVFGAAGRVGWCRPPECVMLGRKQAES
jgi:gas vesicle protein